MIISSGPFKKSPLHPPDWGTQITLISLNTNQPTLGIARAGTTVNVTWPLDTDPAFGLQSNTNLVSTNSWTAVTSLPVISINQNIVTLPMTNRPVFFRLKK